MASQRDFTGLSADSLESFHDQAVSDLHMGVGDALMLPAPTRLWMKTSPAKFDMNTFADSSKAVRKSMARVAGQAILDFEAASWDMKVEADHTSSMVNVARLMSFTLPPTEEHWEPGPFLSEAIHSSLD
jgi:hypothetical protein